MCDCEFDPETAEPGEEACHYLRVCPFCTAHWAGLHCPHDGVQNPCPLCGLRPPPVSE